MDAAAITRALKRLHVPATKAQQAGDTFGATPTVNRDVPPAIHRACAASPCTVEQRTGGSLRITLPFAARTKKNHGRGVAKQSAAFVRFKWQVVEGLAPHVYRLGLPLPDAYYNLAAVYYVDGPGKLADLVGLHQGLCDLLQLARVIDDDWQFRTLDGSRIVFDESPRVELEITALESVSGTVTDPTSAG